MQQKKIIYIAHPISGDILDNLTSIRKIVRHLNLSRNDIVPFVPYYVDVVSLDDNNPFERSRGFENNTALFEAGIIDELWLCGPRLSAGMKHEIELAKANGIPVIATSEAMNMQLEEYELIR